MTDPSPIEAPGQADTGPAPAAEPEVSVELLPITLHGHPVLHRPADPVTDFGAALDALVARMFATMYAAHGVGLAGPQVDVGLRIFVFDCMGVKGVLCNPEVERTGVELQEDEEGCLSVPGLYYPTPRAERVRVTGVDAAAQPVSYQGDGFLARCFQHETDHLNGTLYVDRLGGRVRKRATRDIKNAAWAGQSLRHLPDEYVDFETD